MGKKSRCHIDPVLGRYKSKEFVNLVKKWNNDLEQKKVFKTDLHEEAFGEDQILFSVSGKNINIFAVDISEETVRKADMKRRARGFLHNYVPADVRNLPFKDNVFDLILSSSTLDHFITESDFIKSLIELTKVIKPTGTVIITINNKCNLNFYLLLKLGKILGFIPYPVQFYRLKQIKRIFKKVGLHIQDEDAIVHVISPVNSILLLLRRIMSQDIVDKLAERCVWLAKWFGNRKKTKFCSGWFIALRCVKN